MEKYSQEFTGVVDSMIYANSKNGYTVLRLDVDDILVTAVGIMPGVGIGDQLKVSGYYTKHPKYGEQFVVKDCERFQPQTTGAILNYLSSRSIKGIGPLTAQRIVDIFQDKTYDIIEPIVKPIYQGLIIDVMVLFPRFHKSIINLPFKRKKTLDTEISVDVDIRNYLLEKLENPLHKADSNFFGIQRICILNHFCGVKSIDFVVLL